jgi:predicted nucleotidyltransferase
MKRIRLLTSTQNREVDALLQELIAAYEAAFPGRVRGYYLLGSYADGTALPVSDVDLGIVFADTFADDHEMRRADRLIRTLDETSAIRIDGGVCDELSRPLDVRLARAGVLLYGEDTRDRLSLPDPTTYIRQVTGAALHFVVRHLRGGPPVTFPVGYPDPDAPLRGYDPPALAYFYPRGAPGGTKALQVTACWIATASVALATGRVVTGKKEAVRAYAEDVGDEWSGFLADVYQRCKYVWGYRMPADPIERARLDAMCEQMPRFESRYLERHRAFVLQQLRAPDPDGRLFAAGRLGWIVYGDPEIGEALRDVCNDPDEQVRSAAARALALASGGAA